MPNRFMILAGGLAVAVVAGSANAQFQVNTADAPPDGPLATLDNIDEGEALLATGTTPGGTFQTLNFTGEADIGLIGSDNPFPNGLSNTDQFALEALGVVDVLGGTTGTFDLGVNSDDGFRLRVNGVTVAEATGARDDPDFGTAINAITLMDGDVIRLTFFEAGGGDNVEFFVRTANAGDLGFGADDTIALVGSDASGIGITPIPEPTTLGLLGLGGLGLLARRRRA